MPEYLRPVQPVGGRMSSFTAHTRRTTPSREPGTDYYVPIGTPVIAPAAGVVGMTGDSINPPTGRFVWIKFDDGTSGRALHLSRRVVDAGQRVRQGQIIGYSGATGYGKEDWSHDPSTGGAHVHWTFWLDHRMRFGYDAHGRPYSVDFENYVTGAPAGGTPIPDQEEDEMPPIFRKHIDTRPRPLPKGGWHNVYLNEKNHTSFASGRCIVQSTVVVQLSGLPVGAEIQFRLVTTEAGTNNVRGGTTAREAVITPGMTYATVSDAIELTRPDDGVRWQMVVQHDGVTVRRTEVSAVIHPIR